MAIKPKQKQIIRSSPYNPKEANTDKLLILKGFMAEYPNLVNKAIELLCPSGFLPAEIPKLIGKEITDKIGSSSARLNQVIAKQASACIRAQTEKIKKLEWQVVNGIHLKKYQRELLDKPTIPVFDGNIELDSRFVSIEQPKNATKFEYWLKIQIPNITKIEIPINLTNHQINLLKRGFNLKTTAIRLRQNGQFDLIFTKPDYSTKKTKAEIEQEDFKVLGIDIGRNKCVTTSDGQMETTHQTGHLLHEILAKISRQKRGSKNNKQTRVELLNQINYSCKNDIPWQEIDAIAIENIKNMKYGQTQNVASAAWRYPEIRAKLAMIAQEHDVRVLAVNPAYTSQECPACNHVNSKNRSNEEFCCLGCGYENDADIVGAINIRKRGKYSSSLVKNKNLL